MKVTDHIKAEHKELEELFEQFEDKPQMTTVQKLYDLLGPHHEAEEQVVFPPVAKQSDQKTEVVQSLIAEHKLIMMQLEHILTLKVKDELFVAKVSVLQEVVEHHLKEEEEVFFLHAEEVLTSSQLTQATKQFKQVSQEFSDKTK